jgi:sterol desaturase/sphingolipid hydroxylase (fatty acid hydroxylase superfamily)
MTMMTMTMMRHFSVPLMAMTLSWTASTARAMEIESSNTTDATERAILYIQDRLFSEAPSPVDLLLFGCLMLIAFEGLNLVTKHTQRWIATDLIPVRGKHLDELGQVDRIFIGLNKLSTPPFAYLYLRFALLNSAIPVHVGDASLWNTLGPLPVMFIVYDFFYTVLHGVLHIPSIYSYIHKHHHHQKAPSRANVDAVNVHPLEFFLGEYNHLLALYLVSQYIMPVHVIAALLFLVIGALLTGWNHTRFDVAFLGIYDSKAHDVHHRIPQSNYGQYSMFWDHVFGTFRSYNASDRINPRAQLDPLTGKSLEYVERSAASSKKKES